MTAVTDIIEKMKSSFDADAAAGMENIFQFSIEDGDDFYLVIKDGTFEIATGENDDPSVTLIMNTETLVGVMLAKLTACKRSWLASYAPKAT